MNKPRRLARRETSILYCKYHGIPPKQHKHPLANDPTIRGLVDAILDNPKDDALWPILYDCCLENDMPQQVEGIGLLLKMKSASDNIVGDEYNDLFMTSEEYNETVTEKWKLSLTNKQLSVVKRTYQRGKLYRPSPWSVPWFEHHCNVAGQRKGLFPRNRKDVGRLFAAHTGDMINNLKDLRPFYYSSVAACKLSALKLIDYKERDKILFQHFNIGYYALNYRSCSFGDIQHLCHDFHWDINRYCSSKTREALSMLCASVRVVKDWHKAIITGQPQP